MAVLFKTVNGLKRQAKIKKRADGIKHTEALEAVSIAAGFQSYKHALSVLETSA